MKDKKQQKKPQGKQNKQKIKEAIPLALSFGKIDIIYRIEFSEKDLEKPENENQEEKLYDIEKINSIKDLSFIQGKKNIWDKIQLIPNNSTLEQLIIANKIAKKKMHVDYIGFGSPKFGGDDEYFNEIFAYVNEKHFIDINSRSLTDSPAYSITFELIFKDKTHSFNLGEGSKKEGEEDKKEGGGEKKEDEDYEENDAMKQGRIPKFSRKDSILCKLYPRYSRYCSFYLNFDELKDIPRDFEKRDLIEFLFFLKKKGTKIFLNFYQPQDKEEKKEEDLGNKNKDNKIAGEAYDSSGNQKEKEAEKEKQK